MRVFIALLLFAFPAQAHLVCVHSSYDLRETLEQEAGEAIQGQGIGSAGLLVQHLLSPENGKWSFLVTSSNGQQCLLDAGEDWEVIKPQKPSQES